MVARRRARHERGYRNNDRSVGRCCGRTLRVFECDYDGIGGERHAHGSRRICFRALSGARHADLARERTELTANPSAETRELMGIYVATGLKPDLAKEVVKQLMQNDALSAHAHDEVGISAITAAKSIKAALATAASYAVGAGLPLAVAALMPPLMLLAAISIASLIFSATVQVIQGGSPIGGVGEPVVPPNASAIANAYATLTRTRLHILPFTGPQSVSPVPPADDILASDFELLECSRTR